MMAFLFPALFAVYYTIATTVIYPQQMRGNQGGKKLCAVLICSYIYMLFQSLFFFLLCNTCMMSFFSLQYMYDGFLIPCSLHCILHYSNHCHLSTANAREPRGKNASVTETSFGKMMLGMFSQHATVFSIVLWSTKEWLCRFSASAYSPFRVCLFRGRTNDTITRNTPGKAS